MIQTEIAWGQQSAPLSKILERRGLRRYFMAELPAGAVLYLIDLTSRTNNHAAPRRCIFISLARLLEFLDKGTAYRATVSALFFTLKKEGYEVHKITKISEFRDESDFKNLVCRLATGELYLDGSGIDESLSIKELKDLWVDR
jgi:hypothetical protein